MSGFTSEILMFMDFVSDHHRDQLSNTGEKKFCLKCFLILRFTSRNIVTVFISEKGDDSCASIVEI